MNNRYTQVSRKVNATVYRTPEKQKEFAQKYQMQLTELNNKVKKNVRKAIQDKKVKKPRVRKGEKLMYQVTLQYRDPDADQYYTLTSPFLDMDNRIDFKKVMGRNVKPPSYRPRSDDAYEHRTDFMTGKFWISFMTVDKRGGTTATNTCLLDCLVESNIAKENDKRYFGIIPKGEMANLNKIDEIEKKFDCDIVVQHMETNYWDSLLTHEQSIQVKLIDQHYSPVDTAPVSVWNTKHGIQPLETRFSVEPFLQRLKRFYSRKLILFNDTQYCRKRTGNRMEIGDVNKLTKADKFSNTTILCPVPNNLSKELLDIEFSNAMKVHCFLVKTYHTSFMLYGSLSEFASAFWMTKTLKKDDCNRMTVSGDDVLNYTLVKKTGASLISCNRGRFENQVQLDFNSFYPWIAMTQKLPIDAPTWGRPSCNYDPSDLSPGFYHILIDDNEVTKDNIRRLVIGKPYVYFKEIMSLKEKGYKFEMGQGRAILYKEEKVLFADFVNIFYKLKQKNPCSAVKGILNHLIGKMAQSNVKRFQFDKDVDLKEHIVPMTISGDTIYARDDRIALYSKPCHLDTIIKAEAKYRLNQTIDRCRHSVKRVYTDSFIINQSDLPLFDHMIGDNIGQLKIERRGNCNIQRVNIKPTWS